MLRTSLKIGALALTLTCSALASNAARAQDYDGRDGGYHHHHDGFGDGYHHHHDGYGYGDREMRHRMMRHEMRRHEMHRMMREEMHDN